MALPPGSVFVINLAGGFAFESARPAATLTATLQMTLSRLRGPTAPLALLVLGAFAPSGSSQGAWTQDAGGAFVQVSFARIGPYDTLYRRGGADFRTGREIDESSVEVYGEYGLTDDWTLVCNVPLRSVEAGALIDSPTIQPVTVQSGTLTELGNLTLGVRRQIAAGATAWATHLDLELPTGSAEDSSGLSTGLDAITLRPTISVGRGLGRAYVQGYAGVSVRSNDYSSDWRLGAETGCQVTDDLLVAVTIDLVESFKNGDVSLPSERLQTGLFLNDQEYVSPGIKGLYQITDSFGLSASMRGALSGNNVPKSPFVAFGITFRL